jgi:hypothetical protein
MKTDFYNWTEFTIMENLRSLFVQRLTDRSRQRRERSATKALLREGTNHSCDWLGGGFLKGQLLCLASSMRLRVPSLLVLSHSTSPKVEDRSVTFCATKSGKVQF